MSDRIVVPEPLFVRSTARYDSYADFWKLVELSGFPSIPAVDVDLEKPGTLIWPTMDMEFIDRLSKQPRGARGARVVFWNLERPDEKPDVDPLELFRRGMGEILEWADEIWISDIGLSMADSRLVYAVLGGHEGLHDETPAAETYDVAHLGILTPRRTELLDKLRARGLRVSGNARGQERSQILSSSKLFLGIDRVEGLHVAAPLRWALGAAFGLPIVHEELKYPYPLVAGESLLAAPYQELEAFVLQTLDRRDLVTVAEQAWQKLCRQWTFRKGVEDALRRSPCCISWKDQ
jgi:hypothetical protein